MFRRLCLRPGRPRTDLPASDTRATTLNSVCGIVPPSSIGVSFPLSFNGRLFWQVKLRVASSTAAQPREN